MILLFNNREHENGENGAKSDTESFAEVSESDLIALALSPNGDGRNDAEKLVSLPSDSTLNSVSLTEVDGMYSLLYTYHVHTCTRVIYI
jgi:hormone-sensitive lipase